MLLHDRIKINSCTTSGFQFELEMYLFFTMALAHQNNILTKHTGQCSEVQKGYFCKSLCHTRWVGFGVQHQNYRWSPSGRPSLKTFWGAPGFWHIDHRGSDSSNGNGDVNTADGALSLAVQCCSIRCAVGRFTAHRFNNTSYQVSGCQCSVTAQYFKC